MIVGIRMQVSSWPQGALQTDTGCYTWVVRFGIDISVEKSKLCPVALENPITHFDS
jgi:hypothetical protein